MDDINTKVLRAFDVDSKTSGLRRDRGSYIVDGPVGFKIIRKSAQQPWQIQFQHDVKEYLAKSDFMHIDRFHVTNMGKPYFSADGILYTMSDYYPYPHANLSDPGIFLQFVEKTAIMHKLLRNIPLGYNNIPVWKNNPADTYINNLATLRKIKKRLNKERHLSDFDVMVLKNYDYYTGLMEDTIRLLNLADFRSYTEVADSSVCHNRLADENMLYHQQNTYIINFSECTNDSHLFDLEGLIRQYAKRLPSTPLPLSDILDAYNRYNCLTKNETDILFALLMHPNKFVKLCSQYYSKKRTFIPGSIYMRVEREIEQRENYLQYVLERI